MHVLLPRMVAYADLRQENPHTLRRASTELSRDQRFLLSGSGLLAEGAVDGFVARSSHREVYLSSRFLFKV